jgi:hypothetical protein
VRYDGLSPLESSCHLRANPRVTYFFSGRQAVLSHSYKVDNCVLATSCELWIINGTNIIIIIMKIFVLLGTKLEGGSEWVSVYANTSIFQLYHGENKLIFNEMMRSALNSTTTLSWIFIVVAHWNNNHWIDMLPHSDTLSWFRANQSLLFLLNTAWLAKKQQISIS